MRALAALCCLGIGASFGFDCTIAGPLELARESVVSVLPEWPASGERLEEPEGSGVVIGNGMTIITALHVVDRALSVQVRTAEGDVFSAEIGGRDKATDLAILKIDRSLRAIETSDQAPELGEAVCAIGNAFGLGLSVTCGVVSGVHRAGVGFNAIEDFVQTDAAVNPGASGGALVNSAGELVGILSAIFTKKSDANIGVNFAASSKLALKVAHLLQSQRQIVWPGAGLVLSRAPKTGKAGRLGAQVVSVRPGSSGDKSGVMKGDIILKAGGWRVRQSSDFRSILASRIESDRVELEIERMGQEMKIILELE